ncbi:MAG TPA: hypothetical protein VGQ85_05345 [Candidatus Limnocylindrales bacterium]|nr:hypothetical protein [Candidatus Limnocylindrales bacterium]
MHPLTALLAAEHLQDLRREAARARLSNEARASASPRTPAWRRVAGGGARALSRALGSVAANLDPSQPSRGLDEAADPSGTRAMAA